MSCECSFNMEINGNGSKWLCEGLKRVLTRVDIKMQPNGSQAKISGFCDESFYRSGLLDFIRGRIGLDAEIHSLVPQYELQEHYVFENGILCCKEVTFGKNGIETDWGVEK